MIARQWLRPPRRALTSFLVVVLACVAALAWLGYRLLDQDRALESQRIQEQLEVAVDLAAGAFGRKLQELQQALMVAPADAGLPDGTILVASRDRDFGLYGNLPLLYYPESRKPPEPVAEALQRAEQVEF